MKFGWNNILGNKRLNKITMKNSQNCIGFLESLRDTDGAKQLHQEEYLLGEHMKSPKRDFETELGQP